MSRLLEGWAHVSSVRNAVPMVTPRLRRLLVFLPGLVFATVSAGYVYAAVRRFGGSDQFSDLHVYYGAGSMAWSGQSLYDFHSFNGDPFIYPPFAGLIFLPLAALPEASVQVLWTLLQLVEILVLAGVVVARSGQPAIRALGHVSAVPLVACLLAMSQPVYWGLFLGQVSLLVTLLAVGDALDLLPRRLQGVGIGVAAAIKLTPLAYVPYLLLTGRKRQALVAMGTFTLCGLLAWIVLPEDSGSYWTSRILVPGYMDISQLSNQSVYGAIDRLRLPGPTSRLLGLTIIALVVVIGYVRARRFHTRGNALAGVVIIGAMIVAVSPVSWNHHQVALVLAAACGLSAWSGRADIPWAIAIVLLMAVPWGPGRDQWAASGSVVADNAFLIVAIAIVVAVPFAGGRSPGGVGGRDEPRSSSDASDRYGAPDQA
jgi:alpha-1,2-mannosyltransferase